MNYAPRKSLLASAVALAIATGWLIFDGCSSTEIAPPPAPPEPPTVMRLPHPAGYTLGDLEGIFHDAQAPKPDALASCDRDYRKLVVATQSRDEQTQGVRELVSRDPVSYHWCFYWQLLELEKSLKDDVYIDERQKRVLVAYEFLVPVARAYMALFHDSRYLRWAIYRYRRLSESVFYRKLELTPHETSELMDATNPFGLWRAPAQSSSVLDKYSIAPAGAADAAKKTASPAGSPLFPPDEATPGEAPVETRVDPMTLSPQERPDLQDTGPLPASSSAAAPGNDDSDQELDVQ